MTWVAEQTELMRSTPADSSAPIQRPTLKLVVAGGQTYKRTNFIRFIP